MQCIQFPRENKVATTNPGLPSHLNWVGDTHTVNPFTCCKSHVTRWEWRSQGQCVLAIEDTLYIAHVGKGLSAFHGKNLEAKAVHRTPLKSKGNRTTRQQTNSRSVKSRTGQLAD